MGAGLGAKALDRRIRLLRFWCIDTDQSDPFADTVDSRIDGVAVDDVSDDGV